MNNTYNSCNTFNYINNNNYKKQEFNKNSLNELRIKSKMPYQFQEFFNKLEKYLDEEIFFFGSIQRFDYFPYSSDIDAVIFVNNEKSTMNKIQNFLNLQNKSFKKFYNFIPLCKKVVKGYKCVINDNKNYFKADLLIYNNVYKDCVVKDTEQIRNMPIYCSVILYMLKFLFYNNILSKELFVYLKKILYSFIRDGFNSFITKYDFWKYVELKQ